MLQRRIVGVSQPRPLENKSVYVILKTPAAAIICLFGNVPTSMWAMRVLRRNATFLLFSGMLVLATLMPVAATSAETIPSPEVWKTLSKQDKATQGGLFFLGCKVELLNGPSYTTVYTVVQGNCLGHTFSRARAVHPNACNIGTSDYGSLGTLWAISNCMYDGMEVGIVFFDANHQPVDSAKLIEVSRQAERADYLKRMSLLEAEGKNFFAGCTVSPASMPSAGAMYAPTVNGACLGHSFSRDGVAVTGNTIPIESACQFSKTGAKEAPIWQVRECNYDGKPTQMVLFKNDTRQQMGPAQPLYSAEQIASSRAADRRYAQQREVQQQVADKQYAQQQQKIAQICPANAPSLSSLASKEPSMYGLAIDMPLPCLHFCDDEPKQGKDRLCVNSNLLLKQTDWGTTSFHVILNSDVFDLVETIRTGDPKVEIADGKIVGLIFNDGRYRPENWLQVLTKKFGNYESSGNVYSWETSASSARLVTETRTRYSIEGQVDLYHPFGDGIVSDDYNAAKFSVYAPVVRARKEACEAAEALKNKKKGF
jgi:hypothetical protein